MNHCASHFDEAFSANPRLTWLPWVGSNFGQLPRECRLLIVGESHYTIEKAVPARQVELAKLTGNAGYTREIVGGALLKLENWTTPTLTNLHLVLHANKPVDRKVFWSNASYYNFVQRPMDYSRRERPSSNDFVEGWKVFAEVARELRPSHCLFIGIGASGMFGPAALQMGMSFEPVRWAEKVSSTFVRKAAQGADEDRIDFTFIQHAGAPRFSWRKWHDYLNRDRSELMAVVNRAATPPV